MQDALIGNQTPSAFREVMAGKSSGVLRIMSATLTLPLVRRFVFSSVSSIVAPAGQPNYAAANAVLNAAANLQDSQVCLAALPLWRSVGLFICSRILATQTRERQR